MNLFLGVDFGLKHIGLAVSAGDLAEPIGTIHFKSKKEALDKLWAIIEKNQAKVIVIGLSEGIIGEKTKSFAVDLARNFSGKIVFQDETLTSRESQRIMALIHKSKSISQRKNREHQLAAALILQNFLDNRR